MGPINQFSLYSLLSYIDSVLGLPAVSTNNSEEPELRRCYLWRRHYRLYLDVVRLWEEDVPGPCEGCH